MKALVIYDSQFGNTERLARHITDTLLKHMTVRLLPAHEVVTFDYGDVDLFIFGCPTQKHDVTPNFESLLETMSPGVFEGKSIYIFDTRFRGWKAITGCAADSLANHLVEKGATVFPTESFFVTGIHGPLEEGEARRAVNWARAMLTEQNVTI